jgi:hypothetical protein
LHRRAWQILQRMRRWLRRSAQGILLLLLIDACARMELWQWLGVERAIWSMLKVLQRCGMQPM